MEEVAYLSAVVLAGVLAWAGLAKARSVHSTQASFEALGLMAPAALARIVPGVELAVAVGLVVAPAWAAPFALGLLVAFSVVLIRALRADTPVSCGCFGATATAPVSSIALVRNGLLALAAVVAMTATGPVRPSLDAVVAVSVAVLVAVVGLALGELGRTTGGLFRTGPLPVPPGGPST